MSSKTFIDEKCKIQLHLFLIVNVIYFTLWNAIILSFVYLKKKKDYMISRHLTVKYKNIKISLLKAIKNLFISVIKAKGFSFRRKVINWKMI